MPSMTPNSNVSSIKRGNLYEASSRHRALPASSYPATNTPSRPFTGKTLETAPLTFPVNTLLTSPGSIASVPNDITHSAASRESSLPTSSRLFDDSVKSTKITTFAKLCKGFHH